MFTSKDGIWWNQDKVDKLVISILTVWEMSQKVGDKKWYENYVSGVRDTLLIMYGEEFTGLVFKELNEKKTK